VGPSPICHVYSSVALCLRPPPSPPPEGLGRHLSGRANTGFIRKAKGPGGTPPAAQRGSWVRPPAFQTNSCSQAILGQWFLPGLPVASPQAACSVRAGACRLFLVRGSRACQGCRLSARQWLAGFALVLAAGGMLGMTPGRLCPPGLPVASQPGACSVRAGARPPPVLANYPAACSVRAGACCWSSPRRLAASALVLAAG